MLDRAAAGRLPDSCSREAGREEAHAQCNMPGFTATAAINYECTAAVMRHDKVWWVADAVSSHHLAELKLCLHCQQCQLDTVGSLRWQPASMLRQQVKHEASHT